MIGRLFTGFAWAGFLFWTLLCLGLGALIGLGGDLLRWIAGTALGPGAGGTVASVLGFIEAFGTVLLAWLWIAGSILIAIAGFVLRRAAANATVVRYERFESVYPDPDPARMKDVTPPAGQAPTPDLPRLPKN